jgi:CheY-like chemotaxis protein
MRLIGIDRLLLRRAEAPVAVQACLLTCLDGRVTVMRGDCAHRQKSDTGGRSLTVLVVDDDPDSREIRRQFATWLGATVHLAANGREALKVLARYTPDLVFLDLRMPHVDGYGVMRNVRANPRLQHCRTVAVTALCSATDYQRTWDAGFEAHLAKPVDLDTVAGIVTGSLPAAQRRAS